MLINCKKEIKVVSFEVETELEGLEVLFKAEKVIGCTLLEIETIISNPDNSVAITCLIEMIDGVPFTEEGVTTYGLNLLENKEDLLLKTYYKSITSPITTLDHDRETENGIQVDTLTVNIPFAAIGFEVVNELDLWGADWMTAYLDTRNKVLEVTYQHKIPVC